MRMKRIFMLGIMLFLLAANQALSSGQDKVIKLATTTSTENSGLLDVLLPAFSEETGIRVKVFAKGTGAAIRDGEDGNVDVILVHDRKREERFLAEGHGRYRLAVMHNDFVIVGPKEDPAGIRGLRDAVSALKRIHRSKARFISRGDDSGTHSREQGLWKETGLPMHSETRTIIKKGKKHLLTFIFPEGSKGWYRSIGQGMGKVLTYAEQKQAYTLTDRGTFLKYKYGRKQGLELEILCEGDPRLRNPYGVIPVNPARHPHVRFELADRFARWLVSPRAQALIASYTINGHRLFFPDAVKGTK